MLQPLKHTMFDGEGGGTSASTGQAGAAQAGGEVSMASVLGGGDGSVQPAQQQEETREQKFARLIGKDGEFKDLYDARMQKAIQDRMRSASAREQAIRPVLDTLAQAFGTDDIQEIHQKLQNANEIWEAGADAEGLTVEQYRQMQMLKMQQARIERQRAEAQRQAGINQQISQWQAEASEMQKVYPGFDLESEMGNPTFARMVTAGASLQNAYEVLHLDEIKQNTAAYTAQQTQRKVTANIQARGSRPAENGAKGGTGAVTRDIGRATKEDRSRLFDYAKRNPGAKIRLS